MQEIDFSSQRQSRKTYGLHNRKGDGLRYATVKKTIYVLIVSSLIFMNSGCAALGTLLKAGLSAAAAYGIYKAVKNR